MRKLLGTTSRVPEELTVIDETISTTGKYAICFGKHFRPTICFDVVGLNRVTGEATRRHYGDDEAAARICWDEYKKAMTAKRGPSEEEEHDRYKIIRPN